MEIKYLILLFLILTIRYSQVREQLNTTNLERDNRIEKGKQVIQKEAQPRLLNFTNYRLSTYNFLTLYHSGMAI